MIKGGTDSVCALLEVPVHSPYKDYGLDLSQDAFEGPAREEYPCGLSFTHRLDRIRIKHDDALDTVWGHVITVEGDGIDLDVKFTREQFVDTFKKFFGKAELQAGDQTFDDNVFIHGDVDDERLKAFVAHEGAQSALLVLLLGNEHATVTASPGKIVATLRRPDGSRELDHHDMALPVLALGWWAQKG
jgi:hypothetical protein